MNFKERLLYLFVRTAKFIGVLSSVLLAFALMYIMDIKVDYYDVIYHLVLGGVTVMFAVFAFALLHQAFKTMKWLLCGDPEEEESDEEAAAATEERLHRRNRRTNAGLQTRVDKYRTE